MSLIHHHHHHHHHHPAGHAGDSGSSPTVRLILSIVLNLIITIAEFVGGIISGSLALLSDALHNLSDTTSLGVSLFAAQISKKRPDSAKTFGYQRAEIIGAFANLIVLILIAGWLVIESIQRFLEPGPVDAPIMLIVAVIGLLANVLTAMLLWRDSKTSLNIRSAYLHIVTDALSSVGVIIGGILIWQLGWNIVDPILCALISVYILYHSWLMLTETVNILMDSSPEGFDLAALVADVSNLDGVRDFHHIHVWRRTEASTALEAHVLVDEMPFEEMEETKANIKSLLGSRYNISHSTLEFEFIPCDENVEGNCFDTKEGVIK